MRFNGRPSLLFTLLVFIFCSVATVLIYAPSLNGGFFYDDHRIIFDNLVEDKYDTVNSLFDNFQTRFLAYLSFAASLRLFRFDPFSYHVTNLVLHLCNGWILYRLISWLCLSPSLKANDPDKRTFIAAVSSLIFLWHPLQTQAVSYVSQRILVLCVFFYLLAILGYLRFRLQGGRWDRVFSLLMCLCAMFTKEIAFTLPVMLVLIEFYFLNDDARTIKDRLSFLFPFLVTLLIIPLCLFLGLMHGRAIQGVLNQTVSISRPQYVMTQFNVVVTYIRLLFFPFNQNVDYYYPIVTHFGNMRTVISLCFIASLLALARLLKKRYILLSFALVWFFVTLSVESSIIVIDDVIQEYRLYLPMAGFGLFLATFLYGIFRKPASRLVWTGILLISFAGLTFQRNGVWSSEIRLWEDAWDKSFGKQRIYENLSKAYFRQGDFKKAYDCFYEFTLKDMVYSRESAQGRLPSDLFGEVALSLQGHKGIPEALDISHCILKENDDARILGDFGVLLASHNYNNLAYAFFLKSVSQKETDINSYLNFSKYLANFNSFHLAKVVLKTAQSKGLDDRRIHDLLQDISQLELNYINNIF